MNYQLEQDQLRQGDLVFFKPSKKNLTGRMVATLDRAGDFGHVALYLGDGKLLGSSPKSGGVEQFLDVRQRSAGIDVLRVTDLQGEAVLQQIEEFFNKYKLSYAYPQVFLVSALITSKHFIGLTAAVPIMFTGSLLTKAYQKVFRRPNQKYAHCSQFNYEFIEYVLSLRTQHINLLELEKAFFSVIPIAPIDDPLNNHPSLGIAILDNVQKERYATKIQDIRHNRIEGAWLKLLFNRRDRVIENYEGFKLDKVTQFFMQVGAEVGIISAFVSPGDLYCAFSKIYEKVEIESQ